MCVIIRRASAGRAAPDNTHSSSCYWATCTKRGTSINTVHCVSSWFESVPFSPVPRSFWRVEFPMMSPTPSMEINPITVCRALGNKRLCCPWYSIPQGTPESFGAGQVSSGNASKQGLWVCGWRWCRLQPFMETFLWVMECSPEVTCRHFTAKQHVVMWDGCNVNAGEVQRKGAESKTPAYGDIDNFPHTRIHSHPLNQKCDITLSLFIYHLTSESHGNLGSTLENFPLSFFINNIV